MNLIHSEVQKILLEHALTIDSCKTNEEAIIELDILRDHIIDKFNSLKT